MKLEFFGGQLLFDKTIFRITKQKPKGRKSSKGANKNYEQKA